MAAELACFSAKLKGAEGKNITPCSSGPHFRTRLGFGLFVSFVVKLPYLRAASPCGDSQGPLRRACTLPYRYP